MITAALPSARDASMAIHLLDITVCRDVGDLCGLHVSQMVVTRVFAPGKGAV